MRIKNNLNQLNNKSLTINVLKYVVLKLTKINIKTKLIFLVIIFTFIMSFNLYAKTINVKCKRFSSDKRNELIQQCKNSCTYDYVRAYSGSENPNYVTSEMYFDYNMFGGIRPRYKTSEEVCKERCSAEVDLFILKHCDGYEFDLDTKDLAIEIIKNMPTSISTKLYDPNSIYE